MTRCKLGVVLVMDGKNMRGIITDGDLRKALENSIDPLGLLAHDFMTKTPYTINADDNLVEAERLMVELGKRMLVVIDGQGQPIGILQIFSVDGHVN